MDAPWIEDIILYVLPTLLCFCISVVFCVVDFNRYITHLGRGTAPMSYVHSKKALVFFTTMGGIAVAVFLLSHVYTPSVDAQAVYIRMVFIGSSVPAVIRSKFFSYQDTKIGLEHFYDSFISWAADAYKQKATHIKLKTARSLSLNFYGDEEHFREDLVSFVKTSIDHRGPAAATRFIKAHEALIAEGHVERDRENLIRLCMDSTNIDAVKKYCQDRIQRGS